MRLAQIGLSTLASLWLALQAWTSSSQGNTLRTGSSALVIPLWLFAAAATLASAHPAISFQDLALHLGLIATALAVARADSPKSRHWFDRAMAIAPIWLAGLIATIYVAALATGQPLNARELHLGFDNPRFLNHAQTVFVPWLATTFAAHESRPGLRRLALLAAGFHVGLAYLDVARGTGLSWLAILMFLVFARARAQAKQLAVVLAGGLLFGMLAFDVLPLLLSRHWAVPFANASELGLAHSRDALWSQALAMIQASPWLGQGGMEFAALAGARAAHPHNIYLQWAAEYGLPMGLLAASLLIKPIIHAFKVGPVEPRRIALAAVCLASLVDAVVSGNFVMPASQIWIACVFGQLLACNQAPNATFGSARGGRAMAAILLVSQLWLLPVALNQAAYPEPRVPYPDLSPLNTTHPKPRFWLNGQL